MAEVCDNKNDSSELGKKLIEAVAIGNYCVKECIAAGADVNYYDARRHATPLIAGAKIGDAKSVELLLKAGADVNTIFKYQSNALKAAVQNGRENIVKLLCDAGADVNLINKSCRPNILLCAIINKMESFLKLLVESGADVNNSKDILIAAVQRCSHASVELLINAGADVNLLNESGKSALVEATENGRDTIVKLLIEAGADVNCSRHLPLFSAVQKCNSTSVEMLIKAGADVNAFTIHGFTALVEAARFGKASAVKQLLKSGARVNRFNPTGNIHFYKLEIHDRSFRWQRPYRDETCTLLFIAGETKYYGRMAIFDPKDNSAIPTDEVLNLLKPQLNLKHWCRKAIRDHLIRTSHVNLFINIPKLVLPRTLIEYLLYDVKLELEIDRSI